MILGRSWRTRVRVVVVSVGVVCAIGIGACSKSRPSAEMLTAEAQQIHPPTEWQLVEKDSRGPSRGCVDVACPGLDWRWEAPEPPTLSELENLLGQADWVVDDTEGSCEQKPNRTGSIPLCQISGKTKSEWPMTLSVSGPTNDEFWVKLEIEP